jgi:hypothetical protein
MDPEGKRLFEQLQGVMRPDDLAIALGISNSTLRTLGVPHVKLTRSSRVYFPDEVVAWLRNRDRS